MKKSFAMLTFVLASTGASGLGAAIAVLDLSGSDALGDVETELITTHDTQNNIVPNAPFCGHNPVGGPTFPLATVGLTYLGGGTGTGENRMVAGSQVVAPMSRFLGQSICSGVTGGVINEGDAGVNGVPAPTGAVQANGLVVALDGVTILGSGATAGTSACNGSSSADCAGEPGVGLAWSTTLTRPVHGPYTFAGWQDVLKILYFGVVDPTVHPPATEPENGKNCNSEIRNVLANNWGSLFQNPACGSPVCSQLQHIFRLDDSSGTSEIFGSILGAGIDASYNSNQGPSNYGYEPFNYFMGTDSFCNDAQNHFVQNTSPGGVTTTTPIFTLPAGNNAPGVAPDTNAFSTGGIVHNDAQDYDPIRRLCAGRGTLVPTNNPTEQVCERATFNSIKAATATAAVTGGAVTAVTLVSDGSGYAVAPQSATAIANCAATDAYSFQVFFEGGGGSGAAATACVNTSGSVDSIALTAGGTGYATAPTADVAWYQGTLGLMVPVVATNTLANDATPANAGYNIQYPTVNQTVGTITSTVVNRCKANGGGASLATLPPKVPNPALPTTRIFGLCPNGDNGNINGNCQVPADINGNPNCLSLEADGAPAIAACTAQSAPSQKACGTTGPDPRAIDPRVFNLFAYTKDAAGNWTAAVDDSGRPVIGAYYRIHASQDMQASNTAAPTPAGFATGIIPVCTFADANNQIGCLVQASPCSLAYGARDAERAVSNFTGAPGTIGLRLAATGRGVNAGIPDAPLCIQNQSYPFWRKMYLNTLAGFNNGSVPEQSLAECQDIGVMINQAIDLSLYVELPDSGAVVSPGGAVEAINGGNAFCEDFDEFQICPNGGGSPINQGFAGQSNGCINTGLAGLAGGAVLAQTTCGNGILEAYEDCDLGTSGFDTNGDLKADADGGFRNGSKGSPCSNICRFTK